MKVTIISDSKGRILATFRPTTAVKDAPKSLWIEARDGQEVHDVEVPDKLAQLDVIAKLHNTHRVEMGGGNAKLVSLG